MKFAFANPPEQALELSGATPIKFPALLFISFVGVLIGVLLVGVAGALLYAGGYFPSLVRELKLALDTQPPLIFLGSLALVLAIHELVHCLFYPGSMTSDRTMLGILPKTGLAYAWCGAPMKRNRYLLVALAPLVLLSIVPLALFPFYPSQIGPLLPMALFNAIGAGGDTMVVYFVLKQIPSTAWVQLTGSTAHWGTFNPGVELPPGSVAE